MRFRLTIALPLLLFGCTSDQPKNEPQSIDKALGLDDFQELVAQTELSQAERAAIAAAPLGSEGNPIRADMIAGKTAYLKRLRCPNGEPPTYQRLSIGGPGPYRSITDIYEVNCPSSEEPVSVYMDMYHQGYVEAEAVEGFTINPAN